MWQQCIYNVHLSFGNKKYQPTDDIKGKKEREKMKNDINYAGYVIRYNQRRCNCTSYS